jgi:NAD/NADP transhydrogenase alpha subunit
MTNAAKSVHLYGIYLLIFGSVFLIIPNLALAVLGFVPTQEVWIRVVGALAAVIGYYYIQAARNEATQFFQWTVTARSFITLCLLTFVGLGLSTLRLLPFAVLEGLSALWTAVILRMGNSIKQDPLKGIVQE